MEQELVGEEANSEEGGAEDERSMGEPRKQWSKKIGREERGTGDAKDQRIESKEARDVRGRILRKGGLRKPGIE